MLYVSSARSQFSDSQNFAAIRVVSHCRALAQPALVGTYLSIQPKPWNHTVKRRRPVAIMLSQSFGRFFSRKKVLAS
jgi:hypothetical protein